MALVLTIQIPQPPAKAMPALIASSKPYWSTLGPARHVWNTNNSLDANASNTIIASEVFKLAADSTLPLKTIDMLHIARGENDPGFRVITVGIDVCRLVDKAEAEAFVNRCSDMMALNQCKGTVVEVHYRIYWGGMAER